MNRAVHSAVILVVIFNSEAARILAVFPIPCYSHQITFRPIVRELARRGHHVTVVTFFPAFPDGTEHNLTEIDIHDTILDLRQDVLVNQMKKANDIISQQAITLKVAPALLESLFQDKLKDYITDKHHSFDVILAEACFRLTLMFSHIYKAPIVLVSSFGGSFGIFEMVGAPTHPLWYPLAIREKFYELTVFDKIKEMYINYKQVEIYNDLEKSENEFVKKHLGEEVPSLAEMQNNVALVLLNVHPIWDSNRPVPPNVVYLGGLHLQKDKELPHDLKSELDVSKGTVYMSFGTAVSPETFPTKKLQMFLRVLGVLPYDVYWKWDGEVENLPTNVKVRKWFPQADLLKHRNIVLFITQGGLQSIDESIEAGVPMLSVPIMFDQWFNADKIAHLKIGLKLNIRHVTEDQFRQGVITIVNDRSFRENVIKLRELYNDKPQTSLESAVWWIEHVIRHKGAKHLKSAAFNMSATDYFEFHLVLSMAITLLSSVVFLYLAFKFVIGLLMGRKVKVDLIYLFIYSKLLYVNNLLNSFVMNEQNFG